MLTGELTKEHRGKQGALGDDWYRARPNAPDWRNSSKYAAQAYNYMKKQTVYPKIGEIVFKESLTPSDIDRYQNIIRVSLSCIGNGVSERNSNVFRYFFGVHPFKKMHRLVDTARYFGIGSERVRQIIAKVAMVTQQHVMHLAICMQPSVAGLLSLDKWGLDDYEMLDDALSEVK